MPIGENLFLNGHNPSEPAVATHPVTESKAPIGTSRGKMIYELFFTASPMDAFTPADVVALYLHRGVFETVLADEDGPPEKFTMLSFNLLSERGSGTTRSIPVKWRRCNSSFCCLTGQAVLYLLGYNC
ncbi:hypothetical protein [Dictyobacter arantiisoli]|uniref:hypothetical protein n=1 Tax=Dictyobacter arantiisoli TaxID=2014874 RepID=UPI0011EF5309|nr:hypothetical protein [Dictyobacter arantiisoli]